MGIWNEKKLPICMVSGGKDSTTLYCTMVEEFGNDFLPIMGNTDHEHPVTLNYVRNLHIMAGGPEVVIVQADFSEKLSKKGLTPSGNSFLDMMRWKGRAPSTKAQFCTEWVKLWPVLLYLEEHYPNHTWEMFSGIRVEESKKRYDKYFSAGPFTYSDYFDCDQVLPLLYTSFDELMIFLQKKGVPLNPLYALGFEKVGCFPCIHARKTELEILPDWCWDKLESWEQQLGSSWFPPGLLPKGWPNISKISDVKRWCKTSHGGKVFDMFKASEVQDAPGCLSTWGICE